MEIGLKGSPDWISEYRWIVMWWPERLGPVWSVERL
jgi:hypothetical protein